MTPECKPDYETVGRMVTDYGAGLGVFVRLSEGPEQPGEFVVQSPLDRGGTCMHVCGAEELAHVVRHWLGEAPERAAEGMIDSTLKEEDLEKERGYVMPRPQGKSVSDTNCPASGTHWYAPAFDGIACDPFINPDAPGVEFTTAIRVGGDALGVTFGVTCPECLVVLKAWRAERGMS